MAFNFFVPDSSNLVDCDCGCGRTVAYNTWRSHKSGGGSFALQVKRTMLHLRGRDGMDAKVDVDDREMDAEKGMDVEEDVDVGVGVDVDVDVGVDVEQDVDMDIGSGEADDMLAAAATDPPAHLLHAVRVRNRESSQPLAALAGQRSEITHYTERLAQAQNIRWSARPVRQMGDSGPKFFADYSSDDKESDNDDDDDMPPLMPVSDDEDEEEEEEEEEDEDEEGNEEDDSGRDPEDEEDEEVDEGLAPAYQNTSDEGGGVGDPNEEDDGERDRGEREQEEGQRDDEQWADDHAQDVEVAQGQTRDDLNYIAISAFAARHAAAEAAAARIHAAQSKALSEEDLDILRPFALKVEDHLTGRTFSRLSQVFPKHPHSSLKVTKRRARDISGFDAVRYSCCINSCVCFVGPYANLDHCPHCKQKRYTARGTPRSHYDYLPLIPRLTSMISNPVHAELMAYRHNFKYEEGIIQDIFDGTHYRELCETNLPNQDIPHFSDPRDIALGLSTDGFGPHRRRKKTCWPIILVNYNLPPTHRAQKQHIINIGTVPGPRKPQDWDSFFWPLAQELLELEAGVQAFDGVSKSLFTLRAHLLVAFGDMPAVAMMMRMKGQNGVSPCRLCTIKGVTGGGRTNYVPLCRQGLDGDDYYGSALPYRTHEEHMDQIRAVNVAPTEAQRERLAMEYGVKGMPLLNNLSSIYFPDSFPLDFMHLVYENLIPNLIRFWKKDFKDLDHAGMGYVISSEDWNAIGAASALSGHTIPSRFGAPVPNLATQQYYMTAEMYSNWTLYIAPIVLRGHFPDNAYYTHFMHLVKLIKLCIELEFTAEEVNALETGFEEWVDEYERLYYRYDPTRLSACPVTIHSLLHIAHCIRVCGPVGGYWAFPMERNCNVLLPAVTNRRYPYAAISNYVLAVTQLDQIRLNYQADDELTLDPPKIAPKEKVYANYRTYRLLRPCRKERLSQSLKVRVWVSLVTQYTKHEKPITRAMVKEAIPLEDPVIQYGKVRIGDGRDADVISGCELVSQREDNRNNTFFKYVQVVDKFAHQRRTRPVWEEREFFGQLKRILVIHVRATPHLNIPKSRNIVLALVQIAVTENVNGFHSFKRMGKLDLVDLSTVRCVVGRVWDREQWTIVDRSPEPFVS